MKRVTELELKFYEMIGYCFDPGMVCHRDFIGEPVGKVSMTFEEKYASFTARWENLKVENTQVFTWKKGQPDGKTRPVSEIVSDLIECAKSSPIMASYIGYGVFDWSREFVRGLESESCIFDADVKALCLKRWKASL